MQKSSSIIIFYIAFLLLSYSNCLNPLKSESKFQKFTQSDLKDEKEKLIEDQIEIILEDKIIQKI